MGALMMQLMGRRSREQSTRRNPVQLHVAPYISVDGRIDLMSRLHTDESSNFEFKSIDHARQKMSPATSSTCNRRAFASSLVNPLT